MQIGRSWDEVGRSLSWLDVHAFITHLEPGSHTARTLRKAAEQDKEPEMVKKKAKIDARAELKRRQEAAAAQKRGGGA